MAWSLRAAILEFWAAEGMLKEGAERGVRTAAAGTLRVKTRRIFNKMKELRSRWKGTQT